jgi:hypothetical protein
MSADQGDKDRATLAELAMKAATTVGVTDLCEAIMTTAQYAPSGSNLGRDMNRGTAAGMFEAMRALPTRLPLYAVSQLPPPGVNVGGLVVCTNGAAGGPVVLFSDGAHWIRLDTLAHVG